MSAGVVDGHDAAGGLGEPNDRNPPRMPVEVRDHQRATLDVAPGVAAPDDAVLGGDAANKDGGLSYRGVAHPIDLTEKGATGLGQVLAPERCPDVRRTRPTPLRRPGRWVLDSGSRAAPGGLRYRAGLRPRRKLVGAEDYLLEALGRGQRGRPMMAQPTPPGAAARAHGSRAGVHPGGVWSDCMANSGHLSRDGPIPRRVLTADAHDEGSPR